MCSGKTTLGQALALASGRLFIDLDALIERREGQTISQIFATRGEEAFRQAEACALEEAAATPCAIVACGGGAPCRESSMDMMLRTGLTVWLQPSEQRMIARLMQGREHRPLIAGIADQEQMREYARKAQAQRLQHYSRAHHTFDSSLLEDEQEIAATVQAFRTRFGI